MNDSGPSARPSSFLLAAALAALLLVWSLNYVAGKITLAHLDPLTLASLRAELVAILLLAIYFAQRNRTPLRARDVWTFAYLGFFGYAVNQGCFVLGLGRTTSEHSVVIIASAPILILLLASALRLEKLTAAKILGMAICFLGVMLLETEHGSPARSPLLAGDLITLTGILGFSIYTVLGKKVARTYDTVSMNTFNAVAAAVLFFPVAVRQGMRLDWKSVGWVGWAGLLYMAMLSAVVGYLLFYWLLRHMEASRVVAINYFQPVVVFLLSIPLLGERPTGRLLESAGLVLLGVYLAERASR
ncbi:MAG: DMT family transporter [Acidobacteriia bacterium]|nr:DMT family transporter [Terriglobia bacterium]